VLRATQRAFRAFQPPAESAQQLLVRELALDGGLRLRSEQPLATLRFKYAFDGCECAPCGSARTRCSSALDTGHWLWCATVNTLMVWCLCVNQAVCFYHSVHNCANSRSVCSLLVCSAQSSNLQACRRCF
jgi:hypothetical protein